LLHLGRGPRIDSTLGVKGLVDDDWRRSAAGIADRLDVPSIAGDQVLVAADVGQLRPVALSDAVDAVSTHVTTQRTAAAEESAAAEAAQQVEDRPRVGPAATAGKRTEPLGQLLAHQEAEDHLVQVVEVVLPAPQVAGQRVHGDVLEGLERLAPDVGHLPSDVSRALQVVLERAAGTDAPVAHQSLAFLLVAALFLELALQGVLQLLLFGGGDVATLARSLPAKLPDLVLVPAVQVELPAQHL